MRALRMRTLILAAALALPTAAAAQNAQLLALVESRLPFYGIDIDVTQLSLEQAGAIHLTMSSGGESLIEKRRRIRAILRWDEENEE